MKYPQIKDSVCLLAKEVNTRGDRSRTSNTRAVHVHRVLMDMAKLEEFCKDNVGNCTFLVCYETLLVLSSCANSDLHYLVVCISNTGGVPS